MKFTAFTEDGKMARSPHNPGALLTVDPVGLAAYKKRKAKDKQIDTLTGEVTEIKRLMTKILEILEK